MPRGRGAFRELRRHSVSPIQYREIAVSASGPNIYFNLPAIEGWYPVFCAYIGRTSQAAIIVSQPIVNLDAYTSYTRIYSPLGSTTINGKFLVGYVQAAR